jgi:hypothetical protein
MLVLVIEGIYERAPEIASWGMIYIQSFMKTDTGIQEILRFNLRNLRGCNVDITDGRNL